MQTLLVTLLAFVGVLAACAKGSGGIHDASAMKSTADTKAVAHLAPGTPDGPSGTATFTTSGRELDVHVVIDGLTPNSLHGFHVHEKAKCVAPDFMSAGGHFNPENKPHGPQSGPHHLGDIPALQADAAGHVDANIVLHGVSLSGPDGIVGHALVLHASPDDYQTQPTGNSGGRIACGLISAA